MKPISKLLTLVITLFLLTDCNKEEQMPAAPSTPPPADRFAIGIDGVPCKDNYLSIGGLEDSLYKKNGSYSWDFGDGSPKEEGDTVLHKYMQDGTYEIKLTLDGKVYTKTVVIDDSWKHLGDKRNWNKYFFRTYRVGKKIFSDTLYKSDTSFALSVNGPLEIGLHKEDYYMANFNVVMKWATKTGEYFDGYSYYTDLYKGLYGTEAYIDYHSHENKIYVRRDMDNPGLVSEDTLYSYMYITK